MQLVLTLTGSVDHYQSESLRAQAIEVCAGEGDVTVDFTEADNIDTSALQVLIALQAELQKKKRQLRIRGASEGMHRWFEVSGAAALFTFMEGYAK